MADTRATVTCPDCDLEKTFEKLATARERIEDHRRETGHDPIWELGSLDPGVERAGDDAGVCGREGCANPDSPLFQNGE